MKGELEQEEHLPILVRRFLETVPSSASLMDVLRTSISFLGMIDQEANDPSHAANVRKATKLIAKFPYFSHGQLGPVTIIRHSHRFPNSPSPPTSCTF